jgi:hypothetical protein
MIIPNKEAALAEAKKLFDRRRRRKRLVKEPSLNPVSQSALVVEHAPADGQGPEVDWALLQVRRLMSLPWPIASSPSLPSAIRSVATLGAGVWESRHLESRPKASARSVLEVSAGWAIPSFCGLCGNHALLFPTGATGNRHPKTLEWPTQTEEMPWHTDDMEMERHERAAVPAEALSFGDIVYTPHNRRRYHLMAMREDLSPLSDFTADPHQGGQKDAAHDGHLQGARGLLHGG